MCHADASFLPIFPQCLCQAETFVPRERERLPRDGATGTEQDGTTCLVPRASHEPRQRAHYDGDGHTYYHVQIARVFSFSSFAPQLFDPYAIRYDEGIIIIFYFFIPSSAMCPFGERHYIDLGNDTTVRADALQKCYGSMRSVEGGEKLDFKGQVWGFLGYCNENERR